MNKLVFGILAHVDAGKTTLSEGILYLSGKTRKLGRVDNKNAYLDTHELERARGITIFSQQAVFKIDRTWITLLDTPGHMDFSAEMERTLRILDYAILVISAPDGIQGHTKTLWRLLRAYNIPTFLFVNKMDREGVNKAKIIKIIKTQLEDGCIDFTQTGTEDFYDQMAMSDEIMMENYLEKGYVEISNINTAIRQRKVFPCFFGSALRLEGVKEFVAAIVKYSIAPDYPNELGARIFKVTRDEQGNRLTHMKLTGGVLRVKDAVTNGVWKGKINQIRIYSGQKYKIADKVEAGSVFSVTGIGNSIPGDTLGIEKNPNIPMLEPVLVYKILPPNGYDPRMLLPKLREIEEEEPELRVVWSEQLQEIQIQVMGEIQIEILKEIVKNRFGIEISFGRGRIRYKETILSTVEGVGHFEPLGHYAEVHLLLEPRKRGSGLEFSCECIDNNLDINWQRLILTHLKEKKHIGVLTGSPITDMKISLLAGRSHNEHTVGGDFREATYRAVRQGLMEARSLLLEPYYSFELELPEKMIGKAMTDIERMQGTCEISHISENMATLKGNAPVLTMQNYQRELTAYTSGAGRLFYNLGDYQPCHNAKKIIEQIGYNPENDMENPTGSLFCIHGSSLSVSWDKVKKHMHIESRFKKEIPFEKLDSKKNSCSEKKTISPEEINQILNKTFYANSQKKSGPRIIRPSKKIHTMPANHYTKNQTKQKKEYLLVDGYNIIYSWPELREHIEGSMETARTKLLDFLCNYQWIRQCRVAVVFDAYRVEGHREEITSYYNIHAVYTREAQTADQYIEKFAYDNKENYNITVATSDNLQQIIVWGEGCCLLSADELKNEVEKANRKAEQKFREINIKKRNYLSDQLPPKIMQHMENFIRKGE
ncbi:MAG: GTP-binding protein [Clostridium sp.]|mgnify:CR=1 FL=1|nr:GTP-binding protein [Clostridium sp.]